MQSTAFEPRAAYGFALAWPARAREGLDTCVHLRRRNKSGTVLSNFYPVHRPLATKLIDGHGQQWHERYNDGQHGCLRRSIELVPVPALRGLIEADVQDQCTLMAVAPITQCYNHLHVNLFFSIDLRIVQ